MFFITKAAFFSEFAISPPFVHALKEAGFSTFPLLCCLTKLLMLLKCCNMLCFIGLTMALIPEWFYWMTQKHIYTQKERTSMLSTSGCMGPSTTLPPTAQASIQTAYSLTAWLRPTIRYNTGGRTAWIMRCCVRHCQLSVIHREEGREACHSQHLQLSSEKQQLRCSPILIKTHLFSQSQKEHRHIWLQKPQPEILTVGAMLSWNWKSTGRVPLYLLGRDYIVSWCFKEIEHKTSRCWTTWRGLSWSKHRSRDKIFQCLLGH